MKNSLKEKMKDAKQQLLAEREGMIKDRMKQREVENGYNIVKQTSKAAQQAIVKEENLEEMIEREEQEREQREEKELLVMIEMEKKKNVI